MQTGNEKEKEGKLLLEKIQLIMHIWVINKVTILETLKSQQVQFLVNHTHYRVLFILKYNFEINWMSK